MHTYNRQNRTRTFSFGLILTLFISLFCLNTNSWANQADWGLVKRFETQLELAQKGNVKAMYDVGRLYERGRGTNKDNDEAAKWYTKAADTGNYSAKSRLGKMYLEGRGVKKDSNKARSLLRDAAKNDVPSAQYQLAKIYEIGIGTGEDSDKALFWYKKAAELGHYQAERKVKKLSSSPFVSSPARAPKTQAKAKPAKKTTTAKKEKIAANSVINAISKGTWARRNRPAGYLPSSIANCKKAKTKTLVCVSTEQERSTGNEIITFDTEATVTAQKGKKFIIEYSNNVLEVETLKNDTPSGVEGDEEEESTAGKDSVHKGKQAKVHKLSCTLNSIRTITCTKDSTRTLKFTS